MRATAALIVITATLQIPAGAPAGAMPVSPKGKVEFSSVIGVAQGCGRGWHRTIFGTCVRNLTPFWPCWWQKDARGKWYLTCH